MSTKSQMQLGQMFLLLLASAAILISCAGEEKPYFDEPKVKLQGADCLASSILDLNKFFEGTMAEAEVIAFWQCIDTAIGSIEKYMVGSGPDGSYKSTDIRWFVGKYFLKSDQPDGIVITDELLDQVMQIKRLFLGGRRNTLTRHEIAQTHVVFRELQQLSLRMNPHMGVLFNRSKHPNPNQTDMGKAIAELSAVFDRFGELIHKNQVAYKFSDFTSLIRELNLILFEEPPTEDPDWLKYVRTGQKIKNLLLLTSEDEIEGNEWQALTRVLSQGLGIFFRVKYFLKTETLYQVSSLVEFKLLYNGIDQILGEALDRRADRGFSTEEFTSILNVLDEDNLLNPEFPKEDILQIWAVLVDRLLTPTARVSDGLGRQELANLKVNVEDWYNIQRYMLGEKVPEDNAIKEMQAVMASPWPYRTDAEGRLVIDGDRSQPVNPQSFTNLNWERALFRLLTRGYSATPDCETVNCGLTKSELQIAIAEITPLLKLMGILSEEDPTFYESLFLEANLFMPRADGDEHLDFFEVLEYAHFAFAGAKAGTAFIDSLGSECILEDGRVEIQCFRNGFRSLFADRFAHLPNMVHYVAGLSDKQWRSFLSGLETSTRTEGAVDEPITKVDVGEIAIFMQYIETLILRFDHNGNSVFDIEEGLEAFELFRVPVKELLGFDDDKEVKIIFTFLLKYGEPPDPGNPISLIRYLHWRFTEKSWKIATDRGRIVNILASLKGI